MSRHVAEERLQFRGNVKARICTFCGLEVFLAALLDDVKTSPERCGDHSDRRRNQLGQEASTLTTAEDQQLESPVGGEWGIGKRCRFHHRRADRVARFRDALVPGTGDLRRSPGADRAGRAAVQPAVAASSCSRGSTGGKVGDRRNHSETGVGDPALPFDDELEHLERAWRVGFTEKRNVAVSPTRTRSSEKVVTRLAFIQPATASGEA